MRNEFLWWSQINCGRNLVKKATNNLAQDKSFIITHCNDMPWKEIFYSVLAENLSGINAVRSFESIVFDPSKKPGKQILDRFCSARVISEYWLEESYGEYLAKATDTLLGQRYIIVSGVNLTDHLTEWTDFIQEYEAAAKEHNNEENKAVFIIETSANIDSGAKKTDVFDYVQTEIDIYSFCVVNVAQVSNESYYLSRYLSELITLVSDGHAEIADKLLSYGTQLFDNIQKYVTDAYADYGTTFGKDIKKLIFLAQLKSIFPLLEMHRCSIIEKYKKEIFSLLPWEDDYRNYKANAFELELRDLQFLSQRIGLSVSDKQSVDLLKNARNTLAHNGILTKEQISAICSLR